MDDTAPHPLRPCPICGKGAEPEHRPFCSARCRLVDLARWLDGRYSVPTTEGPDEPPPPGEC